MYGYYKEKIFEVRNMDIEESVKDDMIVYITN